MCDTRFYCNCHCFVYLHIKEKIFGFDEVLAYTNKYRFLPFKYMSRSFDRATNDWSSVCYWWSTFTQKHGSDIRWFNSEPNLMGSDQAHETEVTSVLPNNKAKTKKHIGWNENDFKKRYVVNTTCCIWNLNTKNARTCHQVGQRRAIYAIRQCGKEVLALCSKKKTINFKS